MDDPDALTQFQRAMKQDLNIDVIHANSCQAKGRIEKLFHTLQDRLVKELRLKNISTIDDANRFVEEEFIVWFNDKYALPPLKKKDLHRQLNKIEKDNLERIFSIQEQRLVNNDFTVRYEVQWYQLAQQQPILVCRKDRVVIEKRLNSEIKISLRNKYLDFQKLPERPKAVKMMKQVAALTAGKSNWKPPLNHPWRKPFIWKGKEVEVIKEIDLERLFTGDKNFFK